MIGFVVVLSYFLFFGGLLFVLAVVSNHRF